MTYPGAPRVSIKPGLCSVTFRALPAEEVIRLATSSGISAMEWGADVHVPPGDLATAARVGRMTADAGITTASYGSYLRAGAVDEDVTIASGPVLDAAVALGAANVRVWSDWASVSDTPDDRRQAIADDLAMIAGAAAERGLTISTEFHAHTLTETAASTRALLEAAGAGDNLFTYWQPMDGVEPEANLTELNRVLPDLSHLHVFWWANFAERFPLAEGTALWSKALAAAGESGRWTGQRCAFVEFVRDDDPDAFAEDVAVLTRMLDG